MKKTKRIFYRLSLMGCFGWIFHLANGTLEFQILAEIRPNQTVIIPFDKERSITIKPDAFGKDENPEINGHYVKSTEENNKYYSLGVSLISSVGAEGKQVYFVSSHPESSTATLVMTQLKLQSVYYPHSIDPKFYKHVNEEIWIQDINAYTLDSQTSIRRESLLSVLCKHFGVSQASNELARFIRMSHILVMIDNKRQIVGSGVGTNGQVIIWSLSSLDPNEFYNLLSNISSQQID